MSAVWWQDILYVALLLAAAVPLGGFVARVLAGERTWLTPVAGPLERLAYRAMGIDPDRGMSWAAYGAAVLVFAGIGTLATYAVLRLQGVLPLNPMRLPGVEPLLAFNTAVSFVTNTNWQAYGGETTLSPFTQMFALGTQNFVSAATGVAVLAAVLRGFARQRTDDLGNAWADLVRTTLYVLLPLSLVFAVVLVSQGVVQTFAAQVQVAWLDPAAAGDRAAQVVPLGPAASQIAIKQLGTNGGGFFNVNSAHPLENPTPLSNLLQTLAILLLPAALCITAGRLLGDGRQGRALLSAMLVILIPAVVVVTVAEQAGTPRLHDAGVALAPAGDHAGGNMEGKEVRFGIGASALWAVATTAASNGSVNAMHDSFTPVGGLVPMWLMQLGEIVFGGVGSGLYGMLAFAVIAVFISGLLVGRTPEYLGKKLEAYEMQMASLVVLIPSAVVLLGTALSVAAAAGRAGIFNPGAHGFSEVLYAWSSAANNNGSAFGGLGANAPFYNVGLGMAMWLGRFGVIIPVLAMAGALAGKPRTPAGAGTLPTHGPLFVAVLVATIALVGALTFLPALALGPIIEHFQLMTGSRP
jgi:K+-transporting ATPase ATPase A chain